MDTDTDDLTAAYMVGYHKRDDEVAALKAEIERIDADRATQAHMLIAAHKMLQDAGVECGSAQYLEQWKHAETFNACLKVIEEAAEVQHACAKAMTFGLRNWHPQTKVVNLVALRHELADLGKAMSELDAALSDEEE